ncbi:hypothetical protein ACG04Q_00780 [Roseateles sp. DXS20W]|uniref:Peptidase S8/S53 domain-containing protein n=1 Tax=Pelomonas lactea TaxID=3299030 RepID=A0ABW7GE04_9BURK
MKLRSSLIALACLASFGAAHALTPAEIVAARADGSLKEVRLTGASALRLLVGAYIQADLAQPSTFDVFFDSATGANHRAYSFKTKVAIGTWPVGTPVLVTKRDAGGSAQGVTPLVNADATQTHMLVDASCTTAAGGVSPATDIQKAGFICAGTVAGLAHAGFSDVEPPLLQAIVNGGSGLDTSILDAAGFVQNIFAIGVNKKLYLALQKAQGLVAANATVIDESAAAQPSIPKSFISGALTGQLLGSSAASKKGWNLLIPATVDSNINNKRINVCRRTPGSGTQAASNLYFANNPCGGNANQYTPTAGTTSATLAVLGSLTTLQNSSTQNVENCLGTVEALADSTGGGYAFGVLGRENNPLANGGDKGYRYVKLSGATPTRAGLIAGEYDFAVEASMQWPKAEATNAPSAEVLALLTKLRAELGKASILQGLDADLQNGLAALPSTVTGAWSDLDATTKSFTSHTNRTSANSCSFVRMTK